MSLHLARAVLMDALRAAPRRFRLPALPSDAGTADASGTDVALAFAIECARIAHERQATPAPEARELFMRHLARLVRAALDDERGDASLQAEVLRAQDTQVDEYAKLSLTLAADARLVRAAVNAVAHPGKLQGADAGDHRDALLQLHGFAAAGSWTPLRDAAQRLLQLHPSDPRVSSSLRALLTGPALQRLERIDVLLQLANVQRYLALCAQRGPLAGSDDAAAQGRTAARNGRAAETAVMDALGEVAATLDRCEGSGGHLRAVRNLRTPAGFPGDASRAKNEWDAAILGTAGGDEVEILLLAEVKASPAAAASDFPRLHRGLERFALAEPGGTYMFESADGALHLRGETLRALTPRGRSLPAHVIYCCPGPADPQVSPLNAAARAMLLADPSCVAFAHELTQNAPRADAVLAHTWERLTTEPRLRPVLFQFETARVAREAMLHPQDLVQAVTWQAAHSGSR